MKKTFTNKRFFKQKSHKFLKNSKNFQNKSFQKQNSFQQGQIHFQITFEKVIIISKTKTVFKEKFKIMDKGSILKIEKFFNKIHILDIKIVFNIQIKNHLPQEILRNWKQKEGKLCLLNLKIQTFQTQIKRKR